MAASLPWSSWGWGWVTASRFHRASSGAGLEGTGSHDAWPPEQPTSLTGFQTARLVTPAPSPVGAVARPRSPGWGWMSADPGQNDAPPTQAQVGGLGQPAHLYTVFSRCRSSKPHRISAA